MSLSAFDNKARRKARVSVWFLAGNIFLLVVLGLIAAFGFPEFRKMFDDIQCNLPALTRFLVDSPWEVHALLLASLGIALIIKELYVRNRSVTMTINCLGLLVEVALIFVVIIGLFRPLLGLVQQL